MDDLFYLKTKNLSIFQQLQIEEAFLHLEKRNLVIFNEEIFEKTLILGRSGKKELINEDFYQKDPIPILRRYSGGGTVVVDKNTLFISFIMENASFEKPTFPETLHQYFGDFYEKALKLQNFSCLEQDYVIGERKCGGNAQYIRKNRFVHHTSFLWDFDPSSMLLLQNPFKAPCYRQGRSHEEFLCKMKDFFPSKEKIFDLCFHELENRFVLHEIFLENLLPLKQNEHRKSTEKILFSSL
jgi:lipoate---protein ligase